MSTTSAEPSALDKLQHRLGDPSVADSLIRLLDHLDTVSFAVESMDGFIRRGEVIADSITETTSELKNANNEQALDFIHRAPDRIATGTKLADAAAALNVDELEKSKVLERLTDPETLATLNQLLDRLPLAAFLLESLAGFIARGDTVADNLSDAVQELQLGKLNIEPQQFASLLSSLPKLKEAGDKLLNSSLMDDGLPKVIEAGVSMVDSGMLDKNVVSALGELGRQGVETYVEVSSKPAAPIGGLFATLRATKDPDIQKSLGFFLAFAKAFAKHLK